MKLSRRRILQLPIGAAALAGVPGVGRAQSYPVRPVRIIVPYPPGGAPDIVARLIAQWLSERLGNQFVIENRPGAGGNIGSEAAARAPADGYTLLYVVTANAISVTLFDKLNFNFMREIAPVAGVTRVPNVVSVTPSLPVETIPQLIDYAKSNPGKLNFGAPTAGTILLAGELFKMMTGVNIVHVPYGGGGGQVLTDLLAGRLQVSFDLMPAMVEYVRAGKIRGLAVTSEARSPALPNLPTVGDFVPGYEASSWHGIGVPKNTPPPVIEKLSNEISAVLADPAMATRLAELGGVPMPMTPQQFGEFFAAEAQKWAKVVSFAGIKPD